MAKASSEEWERVMRFVNELEHELKYWTMTNEELGKWVRSNAPPMTRTVFGYFVLVDNCCDPNATTLQWKPEWLEAMNDKERLDWLDENMHYVGGGDGGTYSFKTPADVECGLLRVAIDAAMPTKETKSV